METTVEKLRQTLKLLEPAVSKKATLPVTQGVLFAEGQARATNLEVAIVVDVPELGEEQFVLPFKTAMEILNHIPGNQVITLSFDEGEIKITSLRSQVKLAAGTVEDFPPLPTVEEEEEEALDGDAFLAGLQKVQRYAATDTSRPILTGVCITLGDQLEVAGADGYRLAWQTLELKLRPKESVQQVVLPSSSVSILAKLWKAADKAPAMELSPVVGALPHHPSLHVARLATAKRLMRVAHNNNTGQIRFSFGGVTMFSQLLQGTFPNYKELIPGGGENMVTVDAGDFLQALQQVAPVAQQGSNIIRLSWSVDEMRLNASGEDTGSVEATIPATATDEAHIAFNIRMLADYFRGKEGPVTLETTTPSSPGLFSYRGMPHVLIMPMHVQEVADQAQATEEGEAAEEPEGPQEEVTEAAAPDDAAPPEPAQTEDKPKRRRGRKSKAPVDEPSEEAEEPSEEVPGAH